MFERTVSNDIDAVGNHQIGHQLAIHVQIVNKRQGIVTEFNGTPSSQIGDIYRLQGVAKRTLLNGGDAVADNHRLKICTIGEPTALYHRFVMSNRGQGVTLGKRILPNGCNAGTYGHRCQGVATGKRTLPDSGDAVWDGH